MTACKLYSCPNREAEETSGAVRFTPDGAAEYAIHSLIQVDHARTRYSSHDELVRVIELEIEGLAVDLKRLASTFAGDMALGILAARDDEQRHVTTLQAEHAEQRKTIIALRSLIATITAAPVETTGRSSLVWRTHGESVAVTATQANLINECHEATRRF